MKGRTKQIAFIIIGCLITATITALMQVFVFGGINNKSGVCFINFIMGGLIGFISNRVK